jgi:hypothetical protein
MFKNRLEAIKKLEKLAAWHRINAEYAGADWVWEVRLRAAEDLERRAAAMRMQLPDDREAAANERGEIHEERASGLVPRLRGNQNDGAIAVSKCGPATRHRVARENRPHRRVEAPVQGRRKTRRLNVDADGQGDLTGHDGEHQAVFVYQIVPAFQRCKELVRTAECDPFDQAQCQQD